MSLFAPQRKRKPVGKTKRKLLWSKQKGRCARCGRSFKQMKVRPIVHHKTGEPTRRSRISSLALLCPNCSSTMHSYKTVKRATIFGVEKKRKLVVKELRRLPRPKRNKRTSKTRKKKSTRRRR